MTMRWRIARWLSFALLVACAGDVTSPEPEHPTLRLNATTLAFSAVQNGDSVVQSVNVSSSGAPIAWSAVSNVPWLTIKPEGGTTPATLTIVAKGTGMSPGTHSGLVSITPAGSPGTPQQLAVELKLAPAPLITLAPISLSFTGIAGREVPDAQSVVVNTGEGAARPWTATPSAPWITVNPSSGTGAGAISVKVDATNLAAGTYAGSISISASGTGNSPQSVPVVLVVAPRYTISISAAPAELGTVTGGGSYAGGETATLVATPAAGAEFVNWVEGGIPVSTSALYAFLVGGNRTIVANFRPKTGSTVTVTTSSVPANGGTTSGGGLVTVGSSTSVSATPAAGFAFVSWTDNGTVVSTNATYTFTVTAARSLVANFASAPSVTITTTATPAGAGVASGGGIFTSGSTVTVTATANTGFSFANWSDKGVVVSTSAAYSFTASASRDLVATFTAIAANQVSIATSSNPAAGGTTSGGGTVTSGSSVTVVATAASGYTFTNWTEGGTVVSTSASYTFTANANRTLVANFSAATVTVTTSSNPANGGTTSGGGTVASGSSVTVVATPASGYTFTSWSENGTTISNSASLTLTANSNRTLVANFTATNPTTYFVSVSTPPGLASAGAIGGAGTYPAGSTVTLTAQANPGFAFVRWTENDVEVSTSPTYTFVLNSNRTLVAVFTQVSGTSALLTVVVNPAEADNIAQSTRYPTGTKVSLSSSTPNPGYQFNNWSENGVIFSTQNSIDVTVGSSDRTIVANYVPPSPASYTIVTSTDLPAGGSVSGGGTYAQNADVKAQATAVPGYKFTNWTENGTVVSTSDLYWFPAQANRTLVAHFVQVVTVVIGLPRAGYPPTGGDVVDIVVNVGAIMSLSSVVAKIGNLSTTLTHTTGSQWTGSLDITSQPLDTLMLTVTARDVNGLTGEATRFFVHDRMPTITIAQPANWDVARPTITYSATCNDDRGCKLLRLGIDSKELARGTNSLSGTLDLSSYGTFVQLKFIGTDTRDQVVESRVNIEIEPSTLIEPVGAAGGLVKDYRNGRALYQRPDDGGSPLAVRTLSTGVDQVMPIPKVTSASGFLAPSGAIAGVRTLDGQSVLYDMRNGVTTTTSGLSSDIALHVDGPYAIYQVGSASKPDLYRRDLIIGSDVQIAPQVSGGSRVAANGDVAYWSSTTSQVFWRHGTATLVVSQTDPNKLQNSAPITDGTAVAYTRRACCASTVTYQIIYYNGSSETELTPMAPGDAPSPGEDYALNGGWTAFTKLDANKFKQVWTRSPTGVLRQVSAFNASSRISAVGNDGSVVMYTNGRYYLAGPNSAPREVGRAGDIIWRDGNFYALIGRWVFAFKQ